MNGAVLLSLMQMYVSTTMLSLVICKQQDFVHCLVFFPDHRKCIRSIVRETWAKSQPLLVKPHTAGMTKGTQQASESQHPGKFQCSVMAQKDQALQTQMLYVADLQSNSVTEREISQRRERPEKKEIMCSSFSPWKHSNNVLAFATDMHPWRGIKALQREVGKQRNHSDISAKKSPKSSRERRQSIRRGTDSLDWAV